VKQRGIAFTLIALAGTVLAVIAVASGDDEPEFQTIANSDDADYEYTIPLGAGAQIDAGESINIIPAELTVRVGESLRIINDDDRGHVVGVFFVGAGEILSQEFTSTGALSGGCSIHPSGEFTLQVLE
jgi:plastocyanin